MTEALPGESAVEERYRSDPRLTITSIGAGLRRFYEELPVGSCPFSWSIGDRVDDAKSRARLGRLSPAAWHEEHQHLTVGKALALLEVEPPIDHLVVCHGDACSPNTVLDQTGASVGHVDLGSLGLGDRWADLAVATWSTAWNFGPEGEDLLSAAYGIDPDPDRIRYYRLLYDVSP
jgi:kanamycin kinase